MPQSVSGRVLIVEDDPDISHLVELHLKDAGCETDRAHDGAAGLEQALAKTYDLVILDLALPLMEGLEVCRRLRAEPSYPLILMLTARSSGLDRVLGLEMGALARVKALLRRMDTRRVSALCPENEKVIRGGAPVIDGATREVTLSGLSVSLTAKEFDLLFLFACHPARVYTRAQLLDLVSAMKAMPKAGGL